MKAPRAEIRTVTDDYHGHKIADPYRWLEDARSPETQRFVAEQNAYTQSVLNSIPGLNKEKLRKRIDELLTVGRVEPPHVAGKYYFHARRDGRQNQPVVYVREGVNGQDRALIDVNATAPDGNLALDWFYPSDDGKLVAYGTSPNGSEISTLEIIETDTGRMLPEKIWRTRAASVAWLPDSSGFYYTRYPRPGDVPQGQEMYNRHVFFHALGSSANADGLNDPIIFGEGLAPEHWPSVRISEDARWLLVRVDEGWSKSELFLRDLTGPEN
ncbi:MAG TPA: hypothetical protein VLT16_08450, partial [Candidatus Limnocylindrales bacterium]|nr:hypothetical protein [Candidatus Limnocylindrales bacterium]